MACRPYLVLLLVVGTNFLGASNPRTISKGAASTEPSTNAKAMSYARLPLGFEPNQGQSLLPVKREGLGNGYSIYLEPTQATLALRATEPTRSSSPAELSAKAASLRITLVGANSDARITGNSQLPGKVNYLLGNDPSHWLTDIPTFARVEYQSVYPDIDMVYYGNQGSLEYDFVVRPGASPGTIRLKYPGIAGIRLASNGDLVLSVGGREVRQRAPAIYQEDANGMRTSVRGHYVAYPGNEVGFSVSQYDRKHALIIDPELVYSGFLGSAINAMAIDSGGNAYLTGFAGDPGFLSFPTTPGALQTNDPSPPGVSVPFVSKLNPSGTAVVYSTYLGGTKYDPNVPPVDFATSIFVDSSGNAIVAGQTSATDFPTTAASVQPGPGGCANSNFALTFGPSCDGFLSKLNATGSALLYSSYLGGTGLEVVTGVSADASGMIYAAGMTLSSDFPTTPGALKTMFNAGGPIIFASNGFVTKIDPSQTGKAGLVYSTYLGGSDRAKARAIAVDSAGAAYVTGISSGDFPVTPGALQATGNVVLYVAKLNPAGSTLMYGATLVGSNGVNTSSTAITTDAAGNAYITGITSSTAFPVTPGAFQTTFVGAGSIFVAKLNPIGGALVYSTFLDGTGVGLPADGSSQVDIANALVVDSAGNAYVTGGTHDNDFPTSAVTLNPMCAHNNTCFASLSPGHPGINNAFVSELNPAGSGVVFSTILGGTANDEGRAVAVDGAGNIYVAGRAVSCDFPTTPGAITSTGYCIRGFVSKISVSAAEAAVLLLPGTLNFHPEAVGTPAPQLTAVLTNRGNANLNISNIVFSGAPFTESNNCPATLVPAANCTFTFGFTPTNTGPFNGQLSFTDNALGSPHIVAMTGSGGTPSVTLSGTSLTFASQVVNSTSAPQAINMKNIGDVDLQISNIAATGDFAQTNNCGTSLALGGMCTLNMTFTPTAVGPRNGSVTITDNASGSPRSILLGGTGTDFTLTPTSSSATVSAGQTANYTVNITPNGSLSQPITVACTGAPAGATCSANPNSIPPGNATVPVNVAVTTTAPSASTSTAILFPSALLTQVCALLMMFLICLLSATRSRKRLPATGAGLAVFLLLCATGCGGGGGGGGPVVHGAGTPTGTYSLTVTATSGSANRSTTLSLTVH